MDCSSYSGAQCASIRNQFAGDTKALDGAVRQFHTGNLGDIELLRDNVRKGHEVIRGRAHYGELRERQTNASRMGLSQRKAGGGNIADPIHGSHQRAILGEGFWLGPVGEVNTVSPGDAAPHFLRDQWSKRCREATEGFQHRVERVHGVEIFSPPEAVSASTHVPVGQHVSKVAELLRCQRSIQGIKVSRCLGNHIPSLGQDVAIENMRGVGPPLRFVITDIKPQEVIGTPKR